MQLVIFKIGKQRFALPLQLVERVIQAVAVYALPEAPPFIPGVLNMHGEIFPVVNLGMLFGIKQQDMEPTDQFIIVNTNAGKLALWVDIVYDLTETDEIEIFGAGKIQYGAKYIQGIVKMKNGMVLIADANKFLSKDELEKIEFATMNSEIII